MNLDFVRRRLSQLHDSLRNEGHNPVEAVALLASVLQGQGEMSGDRLAASHQLLHSLMQDVDANGSLLSIAFQEFLIAESRNGLGQYLTPLPVADFVADVLPINDVRLVLDPFAGSALLLERLGERYTSAKLRGIEINQSASTIANAVGALSSSNVSIRNGDAFSLWVRDEIPEVDVVVTNPPYGASASTVTVDDLRMRGVPDCLCSLKNIPTELLGLELSVDVVRDGGIVAIVLPQSVLTNTSWSAYRTPHLFTRLRLLYAISLPQETFAPFRGVANACVLVGRKESTELPYRFPYFRSKSVGYDDTGRTAHDSDLPNILAAIQGGAMTDGAELTVDGSISLFPPATAAKMDGEMHRLGDVANVFTGRTLGRSEYVEFGPKILKVGDLAGSFVTWKNRPRGQVPHDVFERYQQYHLEIGDICLTAAAHKPRYIALKVDLIDELPPEGAMVSAEVLVIRLHADAPFAAEQLLFYLRSSVGYAQFQDLVRGSTAHLYPSDVVEMLIPPLENATDAQTASHLFWQAAASFRDYLRLEEEATSIGTGWLVEPQTMQSTSNKPAERLPDQHRLPL